MTAAHRLLAWTAALVWMALLFVASAQSRLPAASERIWDKAAHAGAYFVLGWLLLRALSAHRRPLRGATLWAVALTVAYGVSDEWHQSFVPSRTASWADVLADSIGALLAAVLWHGLRRRAGAGR